MRRAYGLMALVTTLALMGTGCLGIGNLKEDESSRLEATAESKVAAGGNQNGLETDRVKEEAKNVTDNSQSAGQTVNTNNASKSQDPVQQVEKKEAARDQNGQKPSETKGPAGGQGSDSPQENATTASVSNSNEAVAVVSDGTSGQETGAPKDRGNSADSNSNGMDELRASYTKQLEQLRTVFINKSQNLALSVAEAKKGGESAASIMGKYSQQAVALQEEADAEVNQLLAKLRAELTSRQLPLELVSELRTEYNAELQKARSQIEDKVKASLTSQ